MANRFDSEDCSSCDWVYRDQGKCFCTHPSEQEPGKTGWVEVGPADRCEGKHFKPSLMCRLVVAIEETGQVMRWPTPVD